MTDAREKFWERLGMHRGTISRASEAPESGVRPPDGEAPLFPHETPLPPPQHLGQVPPHYPMLETRGELYRPDVTDRLPTPIPIPRMPGGNELYDRLRSRHDAWRYMIEAEAHGTLIPPAAGGSTSISITTFTPNPLDLRVNQRPDVARAHVIIRRFTASPLTSADTGEISWAYQDLSGLVVPLANLPANAGGTFDLAALTPGVIVEPQPATLGQLMLTTGAGSVIAATWAWALAFAFVYVRPGALSGETTP